MAPGSPGEAAHLPSLPSAVTWPHPLLLGLGSPCAATRTSLNPCSSPESRTLLGPGDQQASRWAPGSGVLEKGGTKDTAPHFPSRK